MGTGQERAEDAAADEALTAAGEIIAIEATSIRVRLGNGKFGRIPVETGSVDSATFCVGHRAVFRVVRRDLEGDWILSALSSGDPAEQHEFDREFDRLLSALSNHRPSRLPEHHLPPDPLGKEQIEQWVRGVGDAIARIRKSRAKRLNERFYNE